MLDLKSVGDGAFERVVDTLSVGVYLVSADGRVAYMNAAAERQAKHGKALRIVNNRIAPADPAARAALAQAIEETARDETLARRGAHAAIALPDRDGQGCVATLLPLERRSRDVLAPLAAPVAVFVQDPTATAPLPGEAFAQLYGLTDGELRVVLAVAEGLGAIEAADRLGVGERTVRTHLQKVFSKTGVTRQTELLKLLHALTPPNGAS